MTDLTTKTAGLLT